MRLLLKFLSLDIVSVMVVKFPGDFMGHGGVLRSGVLTRPKSLGSFCGMEEVRFLLLFFCFLTSGVPPNERFQSGANGQPEIWLNIREYRHVKPIMTSNGPATERTY